MGSIIAGKRAGYAWRATLRAVTGGAGGTGGGGAGGAVIGAGINGTNGLGGGGGGGALQNTQAFNGGNGGDGVCVVRYLTGSMVGTGGTITTVGSYTIHTFTASGPFVRIS